MLIVSLASPLIRIPNELQTAIAFGSTRSSAMTGVVQGSIKVVVTHKTVNGKPVS